VPILILPDGLRDKLVDHTKHVVEPSTLTHVYFLLPPPPLFSVAGRRRRHNISVPLLRPLPNENLLFLIYIFYLHIKITKIF
jgi:hypothetical protein